MSTVYLLPSRRRRFREHALRIVRRLYSSSSEPERRLYDVYLNVVICSNFAFMLPPLNQRFASNHCSRTTHHFWVAFMLILRRQNQRFETLIQNADPKRRSREYCLCFPREDRRFREHALRIVRGYCSSSSWTGKAFMMTSFKRGYMWFCVRCFLLRISVLL